MGKMTTYKCARSIRLSNGNLSLTDDQFSKRAANLEGTAKKCAIKHLIEFKAGEVFGYDNGDQKMYRDILIPDKNVSDK